jgi:hypothetical protein
VFGHGSAELRRPVRVLGEQPVLAEVTQVGEERGANVVGWRWGDAVGATPSEHALPQQPGDPLARPPVRGVASVRVGAAVDHDRQGVAVHRSTLGERPDGHVPTARAEVVADRDRVGPAAGGGGAAVCHAVIVPAGCDSETNTCSPASFEPGDLRSNDPAQGRTGAASR